MDMQLSTVELSITESNKMYLFIYLSVFICLVDNWLAEITLLYLFRYEITKNVIL